jgi:hypothetical protein
MSFTNNLDIVRLAELIRRLKDELIKKIETIETEITIIEGTVPDRVRYDGTTRTLTVRDDQLSIDDAVNGIIDLSLKLGQPPILDGVPTNGQHAVTKAYVDGLIASIAMPIGLATIKYTGRQPVYVIPAPTDTKFLFLRNGTFVETPDAPYFETGQIDGSNGGIGINHGPINVVRITQSGVYDVNAFFDYIIKAVSQGTSEFVVWPEFRVLGSALNELIVFDPNVVNPVTLFETETFQPNDVKELAAQYSKPLVITDAMINGTYVNVIIGFRLRVNGSNGWFPEQNTIDGGPRVSSWITRVGDII